jgi:hypothetical protein
MSVGLFITGLAIAPTSHRSFGLFGASINDANRPTKAVADQQGSSGSARAFHGEPCGVHPQSRRQAEGVHPGDGGIDALADQLRVPIERERSARPPPEEPETDALEQTRSALAQKAFSDLKSSPNGIGAAKLRAPVRVGSEGLTVLLGRRETCGDVTILGSSNDPGHIEAVAASVASRNLSNVPSDLRTLAEIIRTQLFPPLALPASRAERAKWLRTHYFEESDIWEEDLRSTTVPD